MKLRVLDVMNEALGLVKKSDLGGATALIRKALSGETAPEGETGDSKAPPPRPSAKVIPLPPRRPLGETLRALRDPANHAARLARSARAYARAGARRTVPEARVSWACGFAGLPALCSGRCRAAGAGAGHHAAWMHAESGRFRPWHEDERPCGGVRPHRRLSAPDAPRQPAGLLELVRPAPSEPRLRRAGQAGGAGASLGEGVRRPQGARFRRRPVSGRRDGGGSRRDLPGCVRSGRDPLRPALQVSRRRALRLRRDEGNGGLRPRAARRKRSACPQDHLSRAGRWHGQSRQRRTHFR